MWEPFLMTPTSTRRKIGIGVSYFLDSFICILVLVWISLVELGVTPHLKQGFYCNDSSINYKYNGDTITPLWLVISFFIPPLIMWIIELINIHDVAPINTSIRNSMKSAIWECSGYIKYYTIGLLGKLVVVEMIKVTFGELRPHFLHTCKPDALKDCTKGLYYIEEYSCTGYDEFGTIVVNDSSRSFPSGHSSISFFQAIFMIWFLQEKFPKNQSHTLLSFIQCLFACWACFCSISRITDHRHHWWDVLAGSLFGAIFAVFTCAVLCKKFKPRRSQHQQHNQQSSLHKPSSIGTDIIIPNQNGSAINHHHTSIKRLISDSSVKEEVTLNNVTIA